MQRIVHTLDAPRAAVSRQAPPALDILQPVAVKCAKVLSLLLILEALRQAPVSLDPAKG
jgi:hypothetical protein